MIVCKDHNQQAVWLIWKIYLSIYIPVTGCVGARGAQTIPNNERSDSRSCRLDTHAAPPATRSKQHGVSSREEMLFMYLCFICGAGDSKERAGAVLEPPQIFIPTFLHLVTRPQLRCQWQVKCSGRALIVKQSICGEMVLSAS